MNKAVIELQNIKRNFQVGDETVHALRGVSFTIREGEFVTCLLYTSKERIMEVYLNSIEMGKGIYGAQAAAKYKFKTTRCV